MANVTSLKTMRRGLGFFRTYGYVQNFDNETDTTFSSKKRTHHGLFYVGCSGITVKTQGGAVYDFPRGSLFYIPKFANYAMTFPPLGDDDCSDIQIAFDMKDPRGTEYYFAETPILLLEDTPAKAINSMRQIAEYSVTLTYPSFPILRALGELFETVQNRMYMPGIAVDGQSRVFPAVCYLEKHIPENTPVSALAKMCMLSENRFRTAFKRDTGKTPTRYKLEIKIAKAMELIRVEPDLPAQKLVDLLGFSDASHFYKTFRKVAGVSFGAFAADAGR
ncbi:MAG: helix-turn-helix transcriptional regulator [Clostridia bacterium]|nr:helix-turn-helix transcriptional regulator [Clostridia bacterium]